MHMESGSLPRRWLWSGYGCVCINKWHKQIEVRSLKNLGASHSRLRQVYASCERNERICWQLEMKRQQKKTTTSSFQKSAVKVKMEICKNEICMFELCSARSGLLVKSDNSNRMICSLRHLIQHSVTCKGETIKKGKSRRNAHFHLFIRIFPSPLTAACSGIGNATDTISQCVYGP